MTHVRTSVARISYLAASTATAHGVFSKENPMNSLNATILDRKSGIRGPKTMGEALRMLLVADE
ncbi:MAG TPA: hypothetical protein VGH38_06750, partial [Bryobacteraceae bacterium]